MKKRLISSILIMVMAISLLSVSASAASTKNLLVNPSFENGLAGWNDPNDLWETVEGESGYEPQDGDYFAWPVHASCENTYIYQDVSLAGHKIGESLIFNVMVCNYDQPPHDMGKVVVKFLDASGKVIKEYSQMQRNPDWNSQSVIATLPSGAVTARVELWAVFYVGGDVDAYYDNASLIITTEKYNLVYITEKNGIEKAKEGDKLQLIANNGVSTKASDYIWSSSYELAATVDANGLVTMNTGDEVAIYAKDKTSGVVGVYWINSENENLKPPAGSAWAAAVLAEADSIGIVPDCLKNADLTRQITRREFAATCVKVYEALSGKTAAPAAVNPFTDCNDVEVLKAYNVGITDGTSATTFSPNVILNREQAATMLTRVYKKVIFSGWTLKTDSSFNDQFNALFERPAPFADDSFISAWAKDSVYFMKAKNIIDGVGNNMFAPKHGMTANETANYGLATREQALKISVGMVNNLG